MDEKKKFSPASPPGVSLTPRTLAATVDPPDRPTGRSLLRHPDDREILRLAVPALGALVAEPLFLLADSAIVGHLGTPELAGLGIAGTVLVTVVNLCVFLAYGTTGAVARMLGAGDLPGALRQGIDGIWLAALIGVALVAVGTPATSAVVGWFAPDPAVAHAATTYLRISWFGLPFMLLVFAGTGVLRGLQDTRTPLVVAATGAAANVVLNVVLVYGVGLGIAGSALGTVVAQAGMAAAFLTVVLRGARAHGTPLRPDGPGVRRAMGSGSWLLLRTLTLRAALLTGTYVATGLGTASLAAHQIAFTTWGLLALALDAVAIAAQAIVGRHLGAGDVAAARASTRRMVQWGVALGVLLGLLLAVASPWYGALFTADPAVRDLLTTTLLVAAAQQPVAGWVFVLDGVLIGAGDGRYLAVAGLVTLLPYLPAALLVGALDLGLPALWGALAAWMLARLAVLGLRERTGAWAVAGAVRA